MTSAIIELIKSFISSSASTLNAFFKNLYYYVFFIEEQLSGINFNDIYKVIYSWAIVLLAIMFIKKMIQTYFLFKTGEEDQSPVRVVVGLLEAIIIMIGFGWIYPEIIQLGFSFISQIFNSITQDTFSLYNLTGTVENGFFAAIMAFIFATQLLILVWQLCKRGLELLVLRCTMPFYCIGLINANGGAFAAVMKKFMQNFFTVILQIILMFIAFQLCQGNDPKLIYAIAVLMLALAPEQFMNEFLVGVAGMGLGAMASKGLQLSHYTGSVRKGATGLVGKGIRGIANPISAGGQMASAGALSAKASGKGLGGKIAAGAAGFIKGAASVGTQQLTGEAHNSNAAYNKVRGKANEIKSAAIDVLNPKSENIGKNNGGTPTSGSGGGTYSEYKGSNNVDLGSNPTNFSYDSSSNQSIPSNRAHNSNSNPSIDVTRASLNDLKKSFSNTNQNSQPKIIRTFNNSNIQNVQHPGNLRNMARNMPKDGGK